MLHFFLEDVIGLGPKATYACAHAALARFKHRVVSPVTLASRTAAGRLDVDDHCTVQDMVYNMV